MNDFTNNSVQVANAEMRGLKVGDDRRPVESRNWWVIVLAGSEEEGRDDRGIVSVNPEVGGMVCNPFIIYPPCFRLCWH